MALAGQGGSRPAAEAIEPGAVAVRWGLLHSVMTSDLACPWDGPEGCGCAWPLPQREVGKRSPDRVAWAVLQGESAD